MWGRKSTFSALNGLYINREASFNGRDSWMMNTASGCSLNGNTVYIFHNGQGWIITDILNFNPDSNSIFASCQDPAGDDPISCNGRWTFFEESSEDEGVYITNDVCPQLSCSGIQTNISNGCNGPFDNAINNVTNAWANNVSYFYFHQAYFE